MEENRVVRDICICQDPCCDGDCEYEKERALAENELWSAPTDEGF